ncbi:hypothetical protein COO60DRAFT_1698048 [Scenedesmus sp. NREL 46B-D3]|nr:hypothetical protein COO60DRAFT_1698048 [Scenedesmus sp. NREL 46B-D3]
MHNPLGRTKRSTQLRSTVRTAADFGSPETSERLTEMAAQSEQQQGVQDSSSRGGAGGSRSGDSAGVPDGWGDVSGLSDALGMGEAVEGGYYAYRSIDDASGQPGGGSGSVDPTNSLSFRRRSARGSRGATDPSPYTRQRGAEGSAAAAAAPPPAAGSGGSASAAADVPRAAAAAAPGGDLSANAGERGAGGPGERRGAGQRARGSQAAMPATSSAAASDAGWDTAGQKSDWGGLPDAEAAVKTDVGPPSLMQQDGMGLAGALGAAEGLERRDSEQGALDAAAAAGGAGGMSGAVGGAGGYDGGASEFGEGMDQARAQASSSGAPQVRSAGGSGGQQGAGRVGNKAVDEGLPEGRLAAGIPIVFDFHHWKFCTGGQTQEEAFKSAVATWPAGVRPMVHWSECPEDPAKRRSAHSEYIDGPVNLYGLEGQVDVMIEAKAKELTLLEYRQAVLEGWQVRPRLRNSKFGDDTAGPDVPVVEESTSGEEAGEEEEAAADEDEE